ncbi:hypothetical protein [Cognaticolwellia mytili]|nr:hypothetical protein [Cognaticolwellia mytili]
MKLRNNRRVGRFPYFNERKQQKLKVELHARLIKITTLGPLAM